MDESSHDELLDTLAARAISHGIKVRCDPLPLEMPGRFDGTSVTLNRRYDVTSNCLHLAHSIGSIAQWSLDREGIQEVFDDIRSAKKSKADDPERFERALVRYLRFEEVTSEHAVWLLAEVESSWFIRTYTVYFRADLEAMARFHRRGVAPIWWEFFADWKRRIETGEQPIEPFTPRPIPPFTAVPISLQEIVQEIDGQP